MDNSVTLFLLFTYSFIMGAVALVYFLGLRKNKAQQNKPVKEKSLKFRRKHNLLEKLTDPVYNAQYEIGRKIKKAQAEGASNLKAASGAPDKRDCASDALVQPEAVKPFAMECEKEFNPSVSAAENFQDTDVSNYQACEEGPVTDDQARYEIDGKTLQLLIDTFAYDDFAKIYEKFVHAHSEEEICRLIEQLEDFREDDRLLMILTPLLSHESLKVQSAVNGFIMRTNKHFITEEMVNIIENSEYIKSVQKVDSQAEYNPGSYLTGAPSGESYLQDNSGMDLGVDRSVFFEQPHKLVIEAYQTDDRDRLFAISCALAQYDDPVIVEAMLYINSKLNGESAGSSNILKGSYAAVPVMQAAKTPAVIKNSNDHAAAADIQKFSFMTIDEIFKPGAPESKTSFKQLAKNVTNIKTKAPADSDSDRSSSNDYVKGIKLVNVAKFTRYEECAPDIIDALGHEAVYVRCCAITALKMLAQRCFNQREMERFEELKKTLMSHELFEKNTEVISLCSRAITEMESYSAAAFDSNESMDSAEMQKSYAFQSSQADGLISLARESHTENAVNQ